MTTGLQNPISHSLISERVVVLGDLHKALWRRKWLLLCCLVASVSLAAVYLRRADRTYLSESRLLVERVGAPLKPPLQFRQTEQFLATQAQIIGSRAVIERACRAYSPKSASPDKDAVDVVRESIRVAPVEGTNVIRVSFYTTEAEDTFQGLLNDGF